MKVVNTVVPWNPRGIGPWIPKSQDAQVLYIKYIVFTYNLCTSSRIV